MYFPPSSKGTGLGLWFIDRHFGLDARKISRFLMRKRLAGKDRIKCFKARSLNIDRRIRRNRNPYLYWTEESTKVLSKVRTSTYSLVVVQLHTRTTK